MNEEDMEFENFSDIDQFISDKRGELMDINHEMTQFSRESTRQIESYVRRFQDVANDMFETHAVAARMMADLTGDMIMDEFNLQPNEQPDES